MMKLRISCVGAPVTQEGSKVGGIVGIHDLEANTPSCFPSTFTEKCKEEAVQGVI